MEQKIKTFQIIHLAMVAGVTFAYLFAGNLNWQDVLKIPEIDESSVIFVLLPFLAIGLSTFLFKKGIAKIDRGLPLENALAEYQTASLIRWAVLEGSAFVILFAKPDFVLFGLLIILYLLSLRPSVGRVKSDLNKF